MDERDHIAIREEAKFKYDRVWAEGGAGWATLSNKYCWNVIGT